MNNEFIHQYISLSFRKFKIVFACLLISCISQQIFADDDSKLKMGIVLNQWFSKHFASKNQLPNDFGIEMKTFVPRVTISVVVATQLQSVQQQDQYTIEMKNEAFRLYQERLQLKVDECRFQPGMRTVDMQRIVTNSIDSSGLCKAPRYVEFYSKF